MLGYGRDRETSVRNESLTSSWNHQHSAEREEIYGTLRILKIMHVVFGCFDQCKLTFVGTDPTGRPILASSTLFPLNVLEETSVLSPWIQYDTLIPTDMF